MKLSTVELLHDMSLWEKLFGKNNYIILTGRLFPFFFLKYFKKILQEKYNIKSWMYYDSGEVDIKLLFDNNLSIYDYQDILTVYQSYAKCGYVFYIKEKTDYIMMKKIISEIKNKEVCVIFITDVKYENLLKEYKYYILDDIFDNEKKGIFVDFLKQYIEISLFTKLSFFLTKYYHLIEKQANLEFFFNLFMYLPQIKKDSLELFIASFQENNSRLLMNYSIFDLTTFFFQKKVNLFFIVWNAMKDTYSIEFWYYFWQDQLWYAQLALLNKNNLSDIVFYKKVNRWFIKIGIMHYTLDELLQASILLYKLDSLYKKLQTNGELDLASFFYLWFARKGLN